MQYYLSSASLRRRRNLRRVSVVSLIALAAGLESCAATTPASPFLGADPAEAYASTAPIAYRSVIGPFAHARPAAQEVER